MRNTTKREMTVEVTGKAGDAALERKQLKLAPESAQEISWPHTPGTVDRIVIRPSGRRFVDFAPAAKGAPKTPAIALAALVGQWIDPKNAQSFEIFADGRYRTGLGGEGRVIASAEGLVFSGVLSAWDQGRATLSADRKVIEFYWSNADGSRNYFAFLRASP